MKKYDRQAEALRNAILPKGAKVVENDDGEDTYTLCLDHQSYVSAKRELKAKQQSKQKANVQPDASQHLLHNYKPGFIDV